MPRRPRTRSIRVSEPLRDTLLLYRVRFDVDQPPALEASVLSAVESAIGGRMPDELVATVLAMGTDPWRVVSLTDRARAGGLAEGFVAFASDEAGYWCAPLSPRKPAEPPQVGVWSPGDDEEPYLDRSLARYLRNVYDLHDVGRAERARIDDLRDELVFELLAPQPAASRHVTHPRFGDGVVVQEIRDRNHKLVIDFADGRRTVLARFVTARTSEAA